MKPELSVIKLFLQYSCWNKYNHIISVEDFPDELKLLYRTLDAFHRTNDENLDLHLYDLANLFFSNRPRDTEFYSTLFGNLETYEPNEETVYQLIKSIVRAKKLRELSIASYEVAEGKRGFEHVQELLTSIAKLDDKQEESDEGDPWVSSDLTSILESSVTSPGLKWRLPSLNASLGSLRKGDFGFIFARPETGKTTFLASEISYMAGQATGPILWINNEETGSKVQLRVFQATLELPLEQLKASPRINQEKYIKLTGDRIKIIDRVGIHYREIEKLCEQYKPSLVLFDQIDKIKGFKADREDLALGAIYIWARELAKKYCPVIGVCQADGQGENVRYLTMAHVANAKTSKQAEADWILGIGCIHDTGWEHMRFFNISKNKLLGDSDSNPKLRHGRWEVLIDPYVGRYTDL